MMTQISHKIRIKHPYMDNMKVSKLKIGDIVDVIGKDSLYGDDIYKVASDGWILYFPEWCVEVVDE